jgi:hypothetical protein
MVRTVVDAADFVVLPSWRRITSSRRRCFCLRVAGELGFHYIAVELALLSVQRNRVAPEVAQHEVSVSIGIVEHNG